MFPFASPRPSRFVKETGHHFATWTSTEARRLHLAHRAWRVLAMLTEPCHVLSCKRLKKENFQIFLVGKLGLSRLKRWLGLSSLTRRVCWLSPALIPKTRSKGKKPQSFWPCLLHTSTPLHALHFLWSRPKVAAWACWLGRAACWLLGMHSNPVPAINESPWTAPQTQTPAGRPGQRALFVGKNFHCFSFDDEQSMLRDVISPSLIKHALGYGFCNKDKVCYPTTLPFCLYVLETATSSSTKVKEEEEENFIRPRIRLGWGM
ncbi:hypothetical protein B0T10DRAFT_252709 [Thelonectria olida]|uniref:Uncharacterized protein n=1 Tax=Thelonectria olida TaxID=1576542 RepID=A0A9P8WAZ9_9HYPO|nr:hypothetical protein B0T10DRAFT_252709 [Thelonectria olida]